MKVVVEVVLRDVFVVKLLVAIASLRSFLALHQIPFGFQGGVFV
jgi:hypothetical protein